MSPAFAQEHSHGEHTHDIAHEHAIHQAASAHAHVLNNKGEEIGHADFKEATGGVLMHVTVEGLPPGLHGMHFHEVGDCSDHEHFKEAGGHIEHEKPHGYLHPNGPHAGNLPNLIVHEDGTAKVELYTNLVSMQGGEHALLDEDGSTLMIHVNEDDHVTQPIGGSGERIACGVIEANKE
ncbi:MAG: superoxide dismutase family protein [Pseudomonadota bacterium]